MTNRLKKGALLIFMCLVLEMVGFSFYYRRIAFPLIIHAPILAWLRLFPLYVLNALFTIGLVSLYGHAATIELFFVVMIIASAYFLRTIFQESLPVVGAFTVLFWALYLYACDLSSSWTLQTFFVNLLIIYSILRYYDVR